MFSSGLRVSGYKLIPAYKTVQTLMEGELVVKQRVRTGQSAFTLDVSRLIVAMEGFKDAVCNAYCPRKSRKVSCYEMKGSESSDVAFLELF
ncbi:hypothetical protein HHK36_007159 [Tetracentron sinense]|uniref:Uncharacterized protein n=1 Tax=Tetracentron sinense TaxID=13715 RepID=A0A835DPQ2_TETSI|nr:hypothetical protein HHK36_007159 [Tetracentron sinense]